MVSIETLEIVEWFVESAIRSEQELDSRGHQPVDHERRLRIASIVTQMRQADALKRINTQLECVTEQIMATWHRAGEVAGELERIADVAQAMYGDAISSDI